MDLSLSKVCVAGDGEAVKMCMAVNVRAVRDAVLLMIELSDNGFLPTAKSATEE